MRAVALISCLALVACFPNNARHRTYAKLVEGGLLATGVAILAVSNTGADCDMMGGLGKPECKNSAGLVGGFGLALIIGGLVGFAATVTTAVDDKATTTTPTTTTPTTKPTAPSTTPTPIAQ